MYLAIIHSKVQAYPMVLCYDGKPSTSRKMLVVKTTSSDISNGDVTISQSLSETRPEPTYPALYFI